MPPSSSDLPASFARDDAPVPADALRSLHADGALVPSYRPALAAGVSLYRAMVRLRLLSARMVELQRSGTVAFHASSIGVEAVISAVAIAAPVDDWLFPGVRDWGASVVRGLPIATYVQHAFGAGEDPAKGRSAPDHPPARAFNVAVASGIVGAHLPQAVGAAWAAKIKKAGTAVVALFDGEVTASGDFHNALNFAGVVKPPCVLVGHASRVPSVSLAEQAASYGVAQARVDGMDALAVWSLVKSARDRAVSGLGATLVDAHLDDLVARADAVLREETWEGPSILALGPRDPLVVLGDTLKREGLLEDDRRRAFADEARTEIRDAVALAEQRSTPPAESLFEDVFRTMPAHLIEQRAALSAANAAKKESSS